MGIKKSVIDAEILAGGGSKLDSPIYTETALIKPDSSGTYTLLAAPAAGKVRRLGSNTRNWCGRIWNFSNSTIDVHIQVGGTTVWEATVYNQNYVNIPNMIVPAGDAVELVLDDDEQVYAYVAWSEHDDTKYGGAFISFDDQASVVLVGPVPAGKIYVPLDRYLSIMNLDDVDHGMDLSYDDGTDECRIEYTSSTEFDAGYCDQIISVPVPPIMAGHSLTIAARTGTNSTDPLAIIGWAILDEEA